MRSRVLGLCAGACLAVAACNAAAVSISLVPDSVVAGGGTPIDVALVISGLGNGAAPSLSTYDVDIHFDPAVLAFSGAVFGDPILGNQLDLFDFGFNPATASITSLGTLNVFEVSLDAASSLDLLQADAFTLATLTFNPVADGFTSLSLSVLRLGDALANSLAVGVPLPGTFLLLLTGLLWTVRRSV